VLGQSSVTFSRSLPPWAHHGKKTIEKGIEIYLSHAGLNTRNGNGDHKHKDKNRKIRLSRGLKKEGADHDKSQPGVGLYK
jgi:hypothetical protein